MIGSDYDLLAQSTAQHTAAPAPMPSLPTELAMPQVDVASAGTAKAVQRRTYLSHLGLAVAAGAMSADTARVWARLPATMEWKAPVTFRHEIAEWCPPGEPSWADAGLTDRLDAWLAFLDRHQFTDVAVHLEPTVAFIVVRDAAAPTGVALLEDWQVGLTVYSRYDAAASYNYAARDFHDGSLVDAIRGAMQASADTTPWSGANIPTRRGPQPQWVQRTLHWIREFW